MKRIDEEEKNCGILFMQNCPNEDGIIGVIIAKYLFPVADKLIDKVFAKLFKKKEETK